MAEREEVTKDATTRNKPMKDSINISCIPSEHRLVNLLVKTF